MAQHRGREGGERTPRPNQMPLPTAEQFVIPAETDKDGDTIMKDLQASEAFNNGDSASPHRQQNHVQSDLSHKIFLAEQIERSFYGTMQSSFYTQTFLPHQLPSVSVDREARADLGSPRGLLPEPSFRSTRWMSDSIRSDLHQMTQSRSLLDSSQATRTRHSTDGMIGTSSAAMTAATTDATTPPVPQLPPARQSLDPATNQSTSDGRLTSGALPSTSPSRVHEHGRSTELEINPLNPTATTREPPPALPQDTARRDDGRNIRQTLARNLQSLSAPVSPQFPTTDVATQPAGHPNERDRSARTNGRPSEPTVAAGTQSGREGRIIATPVSRKKKLRGVKQVACTGCMDDFDVFLLIKLPCRCRYCPDCLNRLVMAGCSSAADFPPKCHGEALRISTYGPALNKETTDRYKKIEAEFSSQTPQYCAVLTCSSFIAKSQIIESDGLAICLTCGECTCTRCNTLLFTHTYSEAKRVCPKESSEVAALRQLGAQEDWMQCPACQTMIDKVDGCNHVACSCGVEFCYCCGCFYNEENLCECESDDGGEDNVSIDSQDLDREEDEEEIWPDHRRIFDTMGRQKCWHLSTRAAEGEVCHGCLRTLAEWRLSSCRECQAELCGDCLTEVHDDHIKTLEREHEDAMEKILSIEREQLQLHMVDLAAVQRSKDISIQNHEASMATKWEPHQSRKSETWLEHKKKMGLT